MNLPVKRDTLEWHAVSTNTRKSYGGALRRLEHWLNGTPLTDETLASYLRELFDAGKSPKVANQVVAAVRFGEKMGADTIVGRDTRLVLAGFRRQAKSRGRGQAVGLRWENADKIAAQASADGLAGLRDAAMIAVASDALLRTSEVVEIAVTDVSFAGDGSGSLTIRHSKTDQEGKGKVCYLGSGTIDRLRAWLDAADIREGAVFREVRGGRVHGEGLTTRTVARLVKKRSQDAGFSGATGHSLRVGGAQSLASAGASVVQMQIAGRWSSPSMPGQYARKELAARGAVAKLRYGS